MPALTLAELKQQEKDARKNLILEAARELFAVKDFRQITVREIARQAGVSVGTIYNYYENLDQLFLDIFLQCSEEIAEQIDRRAEPAAPSLADLCRIYVDYLNTNMTFYQMMSHFMLGNDLGPEATGRLNLAMRGLMDRIEAGLGRRPSGPGKNKTRLTAHALFAALNGVMISYARYPGRTDDEIREHTIRLAGIIAAVFSGENAEPSSTAGVV
jgi:AcrR family transcriptional regulator